MATRVIYGNVTMYRKKCPKCKMEILTGDSWFKCDCGYDSTRDKKIRRTIIETRVRREKCPHAVKKQLQENQQGRCHWCFREFEMPYWQSGKIRFLKMKYDHKVPYSYEQRNRKDNWCIACNKCNQWKSNWLFDTEDDCREYLRTKWEQSLRKGQVVTEETISMHE